MKARFVWAVRVGMERDGHTKNPRTCGSSSALRSILQMDRTFRDSVLREAVFLYYVLKAAFGHPEAWPAKGQ